MKCISIVLYILEVITNI